MKDRFSPVSERQVVELVNWALAEQKSLSVQGRGTKADFGYGDNTDCLVRMDQMQGILSYDPTELVMQALPGTPMDEIEQALSEHGQHLAFEPMNLENVYHSSAGPGTIGGTFMANLSGPRRFKSGAARDHILGVRAVSGRGQLYKSGGRVIKNVTGYDMSKLLTGSWGTLSILCEITFKVLPAPRYNRTLCIPDQDAASALAFMTTLAQSPYEISGLAYLPPALAARFTPCVELEAGASLTTIRLEGTELSVKERTASVMGLIENDTKTLTLDGESSRQLWRGLRDVAAFADNDATAVVVKVSVPPATALDTITILNAASNVRWYMDAAGGWFWIGMTEGQAGQLISALRRQCSSTGGSAVLYAAPESVKRSVGVFSRMPEPLAALIRRIKDNFDPQNILNPGRLFPD
ncbi:MAG: FAD-binding protein [Gammaproteobacteria bacterium]